MLGDGCRIANARITDSVIGLRSIIGSGTVIERSVLMGADFYETDRDLRLNEEAGRPRIGIGEGSRLVGTIVDKNARIGRHVTISAKDDQPDQEAENWVLRDGLVIVPKGAIIPDGTVI